MVARQNYAAGIHAWYHSNPIDAVLRRYMRSSDCFEYPNPPPPPAPSPKKKYSEISKPSNPLFIRDTK